MADDPLTDRIRIAVRDIRSDSARIARRARAELLDIGLPALGAIIAAVDDEPYCEALDDLLSFFGPAAEPAIPSLMRRLRSRRGTFSGDVLGEIGAPAIPYLVASLRTADEFDAVDRHRSVLLRLPGEETLAALLAALAAADGNYRLRLITAIGDFGPLAAKAISPLVTLLRDPDTRVLSTAAMALGQIGGPRVVRAVAELVESNRNDVVIAAFQCLGECWRRQAADRRWQGREDDAFQRAGCDFVGLLIEKLNHPSLEVAITAAIELQRAPRVLSERAIEKTLERCQSATEVSAVMERLEGVHREQGLNVATLKRVVNDALDSENPSYSRRAAAALALGTRACLRFYDADGLSHLRFCDDESIRSLVRCLGEGLYDGEDPRQLSYLRAVERIGQPARVLIRHVVFHLTSKNPSHVEAAILALGSLGWAGPLVLDGLEKHLGSEYVAVQRALLRTLATLGAKSSRAVEMLATKVVGLDTYAATYALERLGGAADAAVPSLSKAARDVCFDAGEGDELNGIYCRALGKIATPRAVFELRFLYWRKLVHGGELREAVRALTELGALPDDGDSGEIPTGTFPIHSPPSGSDVTGGTIPDDAIPADSKPRGRDVTGETIPHAEGETTPDLP